MACLSWPLKSLVCSLAHLRCKLKKCHCMYLMPKLSSFLSKYFTSSSLRHGFFHRLSCFSPNWHVEALITNLTVFGGRTFKEVLRLNVIRVGHWSNRNGFFIRRARGIIALYLSEHTHRKQDRWGHREDMVCKPRRELSHQKPTLPDHDLSLPPFRTLNSKFMLSETPRTREFLTGVQAD